MDVERDAQNDQFSRSEPQINSQPSAPGDANDRAIDTDGDVYKSLSLSPKAQARLKSAQEKTGFRSYVDYLEFHDERYPSLARLCHSLFLDRDDRFRNPDSDRGWLGTMVNLTEEGVVLKYNDQEAFTQEHNIIEALCDPPKDTSLQIILFNIYSSPTRWQREMFDYLGLVLQLDPRFFQSMLRLDRQESYNPLCYHPSYVTVGHAIATICQARSRSDSLPDCPGFKRHVAFEDLSWDDYILLLSELLAENKQLKEDPTTILLLCLLPLFRLEIVKIRRSCSEVSELLLRQHFESEDIYNKRTALRNSIDRLLNDWRSLKTYTEFSQLRQCTKGHIFRQVEAEVNEVTANADRLESSLRDCLQLEVGKLGLEESKKSIDVSNRQIEEAKRVKIFTILAFVYVPLNLATSIFGMNIQQLNESGKSLWVFLVTAFVTLAVTGCLWLLVELLNGYQNWQRGRPELSQNTTTSSYNLGERVAMVVWLLRHHHISWAREVGAWWRIMVNDRERYIPSVDMRLMSAGEYVSEYSGARITWPQREAFSVAATQHRIRIKTLKT